MNARWRSFLVVALGVVPWVVVASPGTTTLVFSFGLVNLGSGHLITVHQYLQLSGQIAPFLAAWPISGLVYLGALVSAVGGVFGREDPRLTGGLLVVSAVSQLPLVVGFGRRMGYLPIPVGIVLVVGVAWWLYWPVVRKR